MKSLLYRSNQRNPIIAALAAAIKKRMWIRYQSRVELLCAKALNQLIDGTATGNNVAIDLSSLVSDRNPIDDKLLSIYQSLLTRLGYGDDPIMSQISNPGTDLTTTSPSSAVTWLQEIHVSKTGDDSFGIGTSTSPLATLNEAIARLPRKIDAPIEIILHENPSFIGTDVQTVYDLRESEAIVKNLEFGKSGSLIIYGTGLPVLDMDQPVTTLAAKVLPKAGTQHNVTLGMVDKRYRGSFLMTTDANQLGYAQPIAENYANTIYTRGFNTAPSSPRATKILKPRVVVVQSGIHLTIDGHRSEEPTVSFYNMQIKFPASFADNRSFPISISAEGSRKPVLFDFVSIISPITLINPGEQPYGQVILFRNLKVNYKKRSSFEPAVRTGNTTITNWIGKTVSGTDHCGLALGQANDWVSTYEWSYQLTLDGTVMRDVSLSHGILFGKSSKIENGICAHICGHPNYGFNGSLQATNWAITGLAYYGIFIVHCNMIVSNLFFFRSTTSAGSISHCIRTEQCRIIADALGSDATIPIDNINDRGGSAFLIADDPAAFTSAGNRVRFCSTNPDLTFAAWPAAGAAHTDALGSFVVRYGSP